MNNSKSGDVKTAAGRAFLRSLNILLKFTRLYGFEHVRTAVQFKTAWVELMSAIANDMEGGLLLGVSESKLLLDGVPIDASPAERSFAELLTQAGLASISFTSKVTKGEFTEFVKAFALAGTKAAEVVARLKSALGEAVHSGIKVNEVRFVAEDSANPRTAMTAEIAAQSLGGNPTQIRELMNDPQKLLQMIVAAEGEGKSGAGANARASAAGGPEMGAGSGTAEGTGGGEPMEDDVVNVVRLLKGVQGASEQPGENRDQAALRKEFDTLPGSAQGMLRQALASLPNSGKADATTLLKLAEHMAIRVAMRRYERGEVKVNAVRQMLDRMGGEIDNLRKILKAHEEKMSKSGLMVESHAEILDRQFWASLPDSAKRTVLMSTEAYCVPARNVRQFVTQLLEQGQHDEAINILTNYANCVVSREPQARRRTAIGLGELAELYGKVAADLLNSTIRALGKQVEIERDAELQKLLSAAFVRMTQEATSRRNYAGMLKALAAMEGIERVHPALAEILRPRIGVENRLPDLIEESLRASEPPAGLVEVLRRVPRATAEQASGRFNRCERREECQRLASLAREAGAEGVEHLRGMLRERPAAEATGTVGMLSLLEPAGLVERLAERLPNWDRAFHDAVVRQLASAGAPERARLLVGLLDKLDPLVWSEAVDEIGMSGDASAAKALLALAEGERADAAGSFIRAKAIEALGRLRSAEAAPLLRRLVEEKKLFRWVHPNELRVVAAQAMQQLDPEWAAAFLPKSGLSADDLGVGPLDPKPDAAWLRQRRYARVPLPRTLDAVAETTHGEYKLATKLLSLGGGLAAAESRMTPGVQASLRIQAGLRPLKARVLIRRAASQQVGFEFVEMDLEERGRLRKMLAEAGKASAIFTIAPVRPGSQAAA